MPADVPGPPQMPFGTQSTELDLFGLWIKGDPLEAITRCPYSYDEALAADQHNIYSYDEALAPKEHPRMIKLFAEMNYTRENTHLIVRQFITRPLEVRSNHQP
ncbi:hypothetical protein M8J76_000788 [Diaphorina citri]|nr:hypothetical protein M8J76_000788 [Diaphorina citri]